MLSTRNELAASAASACFQVSPDETVASSHPLGEEATAPRAEPSEARDMPVEPERPSPHASEMEANAGHAGIELLSSGHFRIGDMILLESQLKTFFAQSPGPIVITVNGDGKGDTLTGTGYADDMYGRDGDDILHGGLGSDCLRGDNGNDKLYGEDGDDVLFGYTGDDLLDGGAGDDWLYGFSGNDDMRGGAGADTFVFERHAWCESSGKDTVLDFEDNVDKLDLTRVAGLTGFDDLDISLDAEGTGTMVYFGGDQIHIIDVAPATDGSTRGIDASDFLIA